jgi:hypothetical protein
MLVVVGPLDLLAPPGGVLTPVSAAVSAGFPSLQRRHTASYPFFSLPTTIAGEGERVREPASKARTYLH